MDRLFITFKVSVSPKVNQDLLGEVAEVVRDIVFDKFVVELGDDLVETVTSDIEMFHIATEEDLKRGEEANDRRVREVMEDLISGKIQMP